MTATPLDRMIDRLQELAVERHGYGAAVSVNREARGKFSAKIWDPKGEVREAIEVASGGKLGAARALLAAVKREREVEPEGERAKG